MKALVLIIASVLLTVFVINGYNSFTGTRAKSDDRSDDRTLRKQYDDLVLKNNDLNNSVKTKAKTIKDLNADKEALNAIITSKRARINDNTVLIGKLKRALINSEEYGNKLKLTISSMRSKKTIIKKSKNRKTVKKPVKTRQQIREEKYVNCLDQDKKELSLKMLAVKKLIKRASGMIGKKRRKASVDKYTNQYKSLLSKYKKLEKKIKKLKRRM